MTRRTFGYRAPLSIGPSSLIRFLACSVVQGVSCLDGRDPASASART